VRAVRLPRGFSGRTSLATILADAGGHFGVSREALVERFFAH